MHPDKAATSAAAGHAEFLALQAAYDELLSRDRHAMPALVAEAGKGHAAAVAGLLARAADVTESVTALAVLLTCVLCTFY